MTAAEYAAEMLSVIIPVYNSAPRLARCLDSIIGQSYKNIEIICVNDGSTDASAQILAEYAARFPVIHVLHQTNKGQGAARNAGLEAARGAYITFVDSDDYLDKTAYQAAMEKFLPDTDAVCFSTEIIVEDGGKKLRDDEWYYSVRQDEGNRLLTPYIIVEENVSVCNKIFRAALIREKRLRFPEGLWYEDAEFYWKYMAEAKRAYLLHAKYYKYIRRRNSIMFNTYAGTEKAIDHLVIAGRVLAYLLENGKTALFESAGGQIFGRYFWFSYKHSTAGQRKRVLRYAKELIETYKLAERFPRNMLICNIACGKAYKYNAIDEYSLWQKIFSVKKMPYTRYVHFMGLKFESKRRRYKRMRELTEQRN